MYIPPLHQTFPSFCWLYFPSKCSDIRCLRFAGTRLQWDKWHSCIKVLWGLPPKLIIGFSPLVDFPGPWHKHPRSQRKQISADAPVRPIYNTLKYDQISIKSWTVNYYAAKKKKKNLSRKFTKRVTRTSTKGCFKSRQYLGWHNIARKRGPKWRELLNGGVGNGWCDSHK